MSLSGYKYRKSLTIPSGTVSNDVSNFHYLVYLDSSNFDFSKAKSDGSDIVFTDTNDNVLNFYKEKYDSTNQIAIYHVKILTVSASSDTTIYMYYDNPNATDQSTTYANVFDNQIAYYPFDGNANDLSGNHNGTWNGTEQYDIGVLCQAAKFDGSSYITATDSGFPSGNDNRTISLLLNMSSIASNSSSFGYGTDTDYSRYTFMVGTNYQIGIGINLANIFYTSGNTINNWYHIIIVLNGTTLNDISFYNNGILLTTIDSSTNSSYTIDTVLDKLVIGKDVSVSSSAMTGLIDNFRVFNTALTADQVALLYKMESKTLFTFGQAKYLSNNTIWFSNNF